MIDERGLYVVTGDAGDLRGWDAESLAEALRGPLGELGVSVEVAPRQSGGGGFVCLVDSYEEADRLRARVRRVVDGIVVLGPRRELISRQQPTVKGGRK